MKRILSVEVTNEDSSINRNTFYDDWRTIEDDMIQYWFHRPSACAPPDTQSEEDLTVFL